MYHGENLPTVLSIPAYASKGRAPVLLHALGLLRGHDGEELRPVLDNHLFHCYLLDHGLLESLHHAIVIPGLAFLRLQLLDPADYQVHKKAVSGVSLLRGVLALQVLSLPHKGLEVHALAEPARLLVDGLEQLVELMHLLVQETLGLSTSLELVVDVAGYLVVVEGSLELLLFVSHIGLQVDLATFLIQLPHHLMLDLTGHP